MTLRGALVAIALSGAIVATLGQWRFERCHTLSSVQG
jgi:hypothetical protein